MILGQVHASFLEMFVRGVANDAYAGCLLLLFRVNTYDKSPLHLDLEA